MLNKYKVKYIIALIACLVCNAARADYVLAFHLPDAQCQPCREMKPIEASARAAGCDIRTLLKSDPKNVALVAYYHVTAVPVYIYVTSTAKGDFDSGRRMLGWQPESRLRRFCSSPGVAAVGSATRNAITALFSPYPAYVW